MAYRRKKYPGQVSPIAQTPREDEGCPLWIAAVSPVSFIHPGKLWRGGIHVVRWYYRSVFDELEDMKHYMDSLFHQMYETNPTALLPAAHGSNTKLLPAQRADFRVDVTEQGDEVVVTADLIPGVSKKDITVSLINPRALEISCERKEASKEEREGYYLRERSFGSMTRFIPLPKAVTEDGSTASFRNGVLEVHLRKSTKEAKGKIPIE
jgi:HSP20 family protein